MSQARAAGSEKTQISKQRILMMCLVFVYAFLLNVDYYWVEAPVNYLADAQVKPVTYNPPQGTGVPRREGHYRMFPVRIHDARPLADRLSLDRSLERVVESYHEIPAGRR